jgi:hypothetical protein
VRASLEGCRREPNAVIPGRYKVGTTAVVARILDSESAEFDGGFRCPRNFPLLPLRCRRPRALAERARVRAQHDFIDHSSAKPRAHAASPMIRCAAGMPGITMALAMLGTRFLVWPIKPGPPAMADAVLERWVTALAHPLPPAPTHRRGVGGPYHPAPSFAPAGQGIPRQKVDGRLGMNRTKVERARLTCAGSRGYRPPTRKQGGNGVHPNSPTPSVA